MVCRNGGSGGVALVGRCRNGLVGLVGMGYNIFGTPLKGSPKGSPKGRNWYTPPPSPRSATFAIFRLERRGYNYPNHARASYARDGLCAIRGGVHLCPRAPSPCEGEVVL